MIAKVKYLVPSEFNNLIKKCRLDQVKYSVNQVRGHIVSVDLFNPNPIAVGKWLEKHADLPEFSLEIKNS